MPNTLHDFITNIAKLQQRFINAKFTPSLETNELLLNSSLEIELRLVLDQRLQVPKFIQHQLSSAEKMISICKKLIQVFHNEATATVTETMNFIKDIDSNTMLVKQFVFRDGVRQKNEQTIYEKHNLGSIFVVPDDKNALIYKIAANIEKIKSYDTHEANNLDYDKVRSRLRYSVIPTAIALPGNEWRIDISLTKTTKNKADSVASGSIEALQKIRDELFTKNITPSNFSSVANWTYADAIEIELEYIPNETASASIFDINKLDIIHKIEEVLISSNGAIRTQSITSELNELKSILQMGNTIHPSSLHRRTTSAITLKQITPQVRELTKQLFLSNDFNIKNYWLTDKADGKRTLLLIKPMDGKLHAINDNIITIDIKKHDIGRIVLDSEVITQDDKKIYYVFDVAMFDNRSLIHEPFSVRQPFIAKAIDLLMPTNTCDSSTNTCDLHIKSKKFIKLTSQDDILQYWNTLNVPYEIDGLIFTPETMTSNIGYWAPSYKWKPLNRMTIDFLVKRCPKKLYDTFVKSPNIGNTNKQLYLLFVGISHHNLRQRNLHMIDHYNEILTTPTNSEYFPIQFSPADKPYAYLYWHDDTSCSGDIKDIDNTVCELGIDNTETREWVFHKIRTDRQMDVKSGTYFGNDFNVAESVWNSYGDLLTFDILTGKTKAVDYFKVSSELHLAGRNYVRFVISHVFNSYLSHNSDWVIDLASGKGQDLRKYAKMGIKNLLCVEKDGAAIAELLERKKTYEQSVKNAHQKMNIYVCQTDLNLPWKNTLEKILHGGYNVQVDHINAIVCNLALHYFAGTKESAINIMKLIAELGAKVFMYVAFDGKKVFELLQKNPVYDLYEGTVLKYSIKKRFKSNAFTGNSQPIDVLLPMSNGEYYTEYLIDIRMLTQIMSKLGYSLIKYDSFDKYLDICKNENSELYNKLTANDKEYNSLYHIAIFKRS